MKKIRTATLAGLLAFSLQAAPPREVPLTDLDLAPIRQGWGSPQIDRSVTGKPIRIGGNSYEKGLGSHAPCATHLALDGMVRRFQALVGVDDGTGGRGSVVFKVYADGRKVFDSGLMKGGDPARKIDLELAGVRRLILVSSAAGDGISYDHADWARATFLVGGAAPRIAAPPVEEKRILTPPPPRSPRINGPKIYGLRPGSPFLYRIPCTGTRPIRFGVENLPAGLTLDPAKGIITGRIRGREKVTLPTLLVAENAHGRHERDFRIVVGDTLALTPPMGWNDWYTHYDRVTDATMRMAAEAMIKSGMADYGYQYVNIDDCWMNAPGHRDKKRVGPLRDKAGNIVPNRYFPDMKGLADYIHSLGLKAGLYTSPGPYTCAGFAGSWRHEAQDARQFAAWGFDFLKYDWCSYGKVATGKGRERFMKPYTLMAELLGRQDRDIVFNLCQYGMGKVWEWAPEAGGNCWRTTGDLGLERGGLLPGFYRIGLKNARLSPYARPGHWNDPDYILIGHFGQAHGMGRARATTLTANEQYSYMSLWCLMAAPLIFSGDMTRLDEFTLNVLCNHEVIAVDQDSLGRQGRILARTEESLVLAKDLEDGSKAVGLFNLGEVEHLLTARWQALALTGPHTVRDLWRQRDLGRATEKFQVPVGRHGVALLLLTPVR